MRRDERLWGCAQDVDHPRMLRPNTSLRLSQPAVVAIVDHCSRIECSPQQFPKRDEASLQEIERQSLAKWPNDPSKGRMVGATHMHEFHRRDEDGTKFQTGRQAHPHRAKCFESLVERYQAFLSILSTWDGKLYLMYYQAAEATRGD